jgi:hypothetical protein
MAQRFHQRPNIRYEVVDIRESSGPFATVIWDAAIEHFTEMEIEGIMPKLRSVMTPAARLVGYTLAESADMPQLPTHETHFQGIAHLGGLLRRYFKNVRVFEVRTRRSRRHVRICSSTRPMVSCRSIPNGKMG